MEITKETSSYNQRRYSKPWIAKVDFNESVQGKFIWGDWVGDHYNGSEGTLIINAEVGDIIATGQKDFRQPKNSAPDFYLVMADGKLFYLGTKNDAFKYFKSNKEKNNSIN